MSLTATSKLHELSANARVIPILISHESLGTFAHNLKAFEASLGEYAQEEYWRSRLRTLKRYRFQVCATPLGFDDSDRSFGELFEKLRTSLDHCDRLYPDFSASAHDLVAQAQELVTFEQNPVLEAIKDLATSKVTALLIKEPRFSESTEILLSKHLSLRHFKVRTPSQLRGDETYDELILLGPMRWFPDHVILAPRATRVHKVRFRFLRDDWQPRTELMRPIKRHAPEQTPVSQATLEVHEPLTADEMLPEVDWDAVTRSVIRRRTPDEEIVDAYFVKLAEDNAVFLDADTSEYVIDTTRPNPIQSVKVRDLHTGLFLVVRERGKGAYIVPIADQILGERAEEYRTALARWKTALRKILSSKDQEFILRKLRLYGAQSAKTINVRNWSSNSERKISPRHRKDFSAILTLLDMEDDFDYLWKVARTIVSAHQRAGKIMKKRLLNEVHNASLEELEKKDYQTFKIEEYQTNLVAYRIRDISKSTYGVPIHKVGELLHPEDEEWRT